MTSLSKCLELYMSFMFISYDGKMAEVPVYNDLGTNKSNIDNPIQITIICQQKKI